MKTGLAFAQRRPSTFCDKPGHHRVEAGELRNPFRQRPVHIQSVYRSLDVHWSQMSDVPRNINLFRLNAARSRLDAIAGRVLRRLAEQGAEATTRARLIRGGSVGESRSHPRRNSSKPSDRVRRSANARKYRDYSGDRKNRKYAAVSRSFVADDPVNGETVSEARFPANREKNREFRENRAVWQKVAKSRPSERSKIS